MGVLDIQALIAKQKAAIDKVEPVTQEVLLGDEVVGVRFWPLTGTEYRELAAANPPRPGSQDDMNVGGYNVNGVLRTYPRVYLVRGDDIDNMRVVNGEGVEEWLWPQIVNVLSAPDIHNLELAVWGLNEMAPQQRLTAAGKVSTGGRRKKRSSPSSSGSQSEN